MTNAPSDACGFSEPSRMVLSYCRCGAELLPNLMPPQGLAHDVESVRQWGITAKPTSSGFLPLGISRRTHGNPSATDAAMSKAAPIHESAFLLPA